MLSTYPFHEKSVPIPPTIPMFSCTKGLREKKMVRFSPKTHKSDGLGTDSRGMKGGQPPKSGKFWGNSLTQPRSKGYFGKFLFLGQQGKFLKRFREIYARPNAPYARIEKVASQPQVREALDRIIGCSNLVDLLSRLARACGVIFKGI